MLAAILTRRPGSGTFTQSIGSLITCRPWKVFTMRKRRTPTDKVLRAASELRAFIRPWRTVDVADEWQAQCQAFKPRYKFLVLDGDRDSCCGKTWCPLSLNAIDRTLFVNSTSGYPYLKSFDRAWHDAFFLGDITQSMPS